MSKKLVYLVSFVFVMSIVLTVTAEAVDNNLVAWWKLDDEGTGTVIDSSGNGHDGTLVGDAHFVPGLLDEALELDGENDYVVIDGYQGIVGDGTNTPAFSITAWVRKEGPVGGDGEIVGWGNTGAGNRMEFRFNGGNNRIRIESGGGNAQNDTELTTGQWHHVAMTVRENSTYESGVNFYLDGLDDTRANNDPDPIHPTGNFDVKIGIRYNEDARLFIGLIDDVRFYDRKLDGVEIRDIIERGYLASAHSPDPSDGSLYGDTWATLKWDAGGTSVSHDVYFGTSFEDVNAGAENTFLGNMTVNNQTLGFPGFPEPEGLASGTTYYWRVDEVNDAHPDSPWRGDVWSFWIPSITAYDPFPAQGEPFEDPNVVLSWSIGLNATMHAVYFGTDAGEVENATGAIPLIGATYVPDLLTSETTYYWRVDTFNNVEWIKGPIWNFTTMPNIPPAPDPNLIVWWKLDEDAGINAIDWSGHGYHGTRINGPESVEGISGGALQFDGIDDYAIYSLPQAQNFESFTVALWVKAAIRGQEEWMAPFSSHTPNSSGIQIDVDGTNPGNYRTNPPGGTTQARFGPVTTDWVHLALTGEGTAVQYYYNGDWATSETFTDDDLLFNEFLIGTSRNSMNYFAGTIDDFRVYNRALTQTEIQDLVRGDPLLAWNPKPLRGSILYIKDATPFSWSPGENASQHDVYFGTDRDAVTNADASDTTGIYQARQGITTYTPPEGIEWGGGPYYWRIDEYNTDGTINKGNVWSFTVADFLLVDDFESYNDLNPDDPESNRIFNVWSDGLDNPAINGSIVGYDIAPFVEQTIVHNGSQSMPLFYDNGVGYSEATMTLTDRHDWTEHDLAELSLWFHGDPCNVAEPMYVALNGNAVVTHDNPNAVLAEEWTQWTIDLQKFTDQGVNLANINTIAIGLGNRNNPQSGGSGIIYIDDIRLYAPRPEPMPIEVHVDVNDAGSQVELEQAQILVVTLESNPTTGYRWELVENQESILEQMGEAEFKPSETGEPPLVGAGGWEIFRFKAISAGQMTLQLVYHRSWEEGVEPLKTFSLQVVVR